MKRLLQLLLAVMIVMNFTVVLGEEAVDGAELQQTEYIDAPDASAEEIDILGEDMTYPIYRDMTGSIDSQTPVGFTDRAMSIGPKNTVVSGYAGKTAEDVSSVITSGEGINVTRAPYIYIRPNAEVTAGGKLTVAFKIATDDYNADKGVYFKTATSSTLTDPEFAFVMKSKSGDTAEMSAFGHKIQESYLLGRWYNVELVLNGGANTFDCYLDGRKVVENGEYKPNKDSDEVLSMITDICYGIKNKNDAQNKANIYFDDLYVNYENVADESKLEIASENYTINNETMIISDFGGDTLAEFKAGFDLKYGEKISLISQTGEIITDENTFVTSGMFAEFSSANGRNTLYYKLFDLKISLLQPAENMYIRPGEAVTAEADTHGTGNRVVFFAEKDGETVQQQEKTAQPYLVEFENLENGVYSIYAEVHDDVGNTITTNKVTVTITENLAPVVSFASLKSGAFDYVNQITDSVLVSDNDGTVEKVEIYADGKLIKTADRKNGGIKETDDKNAEKIDFAVTDVPIGMCTIKAVAYDNEYKAGVAAAELDISKSRQDNLYSNTLEASASEWNVANATSDKVKGKGIMSAPGGKAYGITVLHRDASAGAPYLYTSALNSHYMSGLTVTEHDLCVSGTDGLSISMTIRNSGFENIMDVKDGKAGEVEIVPGKWYHCKYIIDYYGKTFTAMVNDTTVAQGALKASDDIQNIRFTLTNMGKEDITVYFKNYSIEGKVSETNINSIETYKEGTLLEIAENRVNPLTDTLQLNLNNTLAADTVTNKNVLVYADGKQIGNYDVSIGEQSELLSDSKTASAVTISFKEPLKSNSEYTVLITKDVKTSTKTALTAKILYKFNVGANELDIKGWKLISGAREINFKGELRGGDKVKLSAEVTSDAAAVQSGKLIFAVYDGDGLIDMKISDISVGGGGEAVSEEITLPQSLNNVTIHGYIWDNFDNMNSVSKNYIMDFTAE